MQSARGTATGVGEPPSHVHEYIRKLFAKSAAQQAFVAKLTDRVWTDARALGATSSTGAIPSFYEAEPLIAADVPELPSRYPLLGLAGFATHMSNSNSAASSSCTQPLEAAHLEATDLQFDAQNLRQSVSAWYGAHRVILLCDSRLHLVIRLASHP